MDIKKKVAITAALAYLKEEENIPTQKSNWSSFGRNAIMVNRKISQSRGKFNNYG